MIDNYLPFSVRRWFYTKLDIKKHSIINLDVAYTISTFAQCDGFSPLYMWYLDGCDEYYFRYDFSPAKHWGDGIIRDFYVEVDINDLDLAGDIDFLRGIEKTDSLNIQIKGLDFKKEENRYEYRQRNFDLKKASPIYISYRTPQMTSIDVISEYLLPPSEYTVKVSSENKKYPASNLSDLNLETVWVPNNSIGETKEFTFTPRTDIAGFAFLNGYYKNETTYSENNRIKKIKVEVKQTGLDDWNEVSIEPFSDNEYFPLYFENLFNRYVCQIVDLFEMASPSPEEPIEKVRITIEEVYPGSKYNDTCVPEIIFLKK